MLKSRNLMPFSHISALKLRKYNPTKLNTNEIRYILHTVAVSVTDVETNLSLQARAVLESYKCYVLNWILIPDTLHDLRVAFP